MSQRAGKAVERARNSRSESESDARANHPRTSTGSRCRGLGARPVPFHARHRAAYSWLLVERVPSERAPAVASRPPPGRVARQNSRRPLSLVSEDPGGAYAVTEKCPRARASPRPRRRRGTGYSLSALSRRAFPRFRSALLPYRSAMLGGVGEQSESLLAFLPPLPPPHPPPLPPCRPFFPLSF